ncbi:hypothetical protein [Pseudomonas alvandae]|uniref:hypothetical protein n=1 Tax=Pseudomonas canavaninivorans TaxID=2842348 RepID=UPI002FF29C34
MNGWRSLAILQKNAIIQSSLRKIGHIFGMMTAKSRLEATFAGLQVHRTFPSKRRAVHELGSATERG